MHRGEDARRHWVGGMPATDGRDCIMISELRKSNEPLYDPATLRLLIAEVLDHRNTPDQVRDWIKRRL